MGSAWGIDDNMTVKKKKRKGKEGQERRGKGKNENSWILKYEVSELRPTLCF